MQYILRMLIKSPIHGRISLIRELKRIYLAIQNQEEYFTSTEHFLPLNEIYVEQGIIVSFKKKRTPIAGYDIESGCLVKYYKKDGEVSAVISSVSAEYSIRGQEEYIIIFGIHQMTGLLN